MLGWGIIKGLAVTMRNFAGSYRDSRRLVTVQYPEQTLPTAENARTFPFLVYDGEDPALGLRCTACTICEQECPPQCIYIVKDTVKKPDYVGKPQLQPKIFDIDISVCMACGICVEVCPFDAIEMDPAYQWTAEDRFAGLLLRKEQLAKPNEYFRSVHPGEAAAIDAARDEEKRKAEAKAKTKAAVNGNSSAKP
jgi:NADH-quinone oxidoreductase subunit I